MSDMNGSLLLINLLITWSIGLTPPLLIRFVVMRRPIDKWPAVGVAGLFLLLNISLFVAMGSENRSHTVLALIAWVSYIILHKGYSAKPNTSFICEMCASPLRINWGNGQVKLCEECSSTEQGKLLMANKHH